MTGGKRGVNQADSEKARAAVTLRVASYNVEFGKRGTPEQIGAMFKPYQLDVVGFCEVPEGDWTARVGKVLGMPYAYVGAISSAGHKDKYKSILSRYPLSGMQEYPVSGTGWKSSAVKADIEVKGMRIALISLHLCSCRQKQDSQIYYLAREIIPALTTDRLIVMGDFNQTMKETAFRTIDIADLTPIWPDLNMDVTRYRTCPSFWESAWGKDPGDGVIDHILYNRYSNARAV